MAHTVSAAVNGRVSKGTAEMKSHCASPLVITSYFVPTPTAVFFHSHHIDSFFLRSQILRSSSQSGSSGKNYVTVRCRFLSGKLIDRPWDCT